MFIAYNDCIFKVGTFHDESKFSEAEASMCEEPPTMSVGYINDRIQKEQPNNFEVKENGEACFINIYVGTKLQNSYKVIGLARTVDKNLGLNPTFYLSLDKNNLQPTGALALGGGHFAGGCSYVPCCPTPMLSHSWEVTLYKIL